MDTFHPTFVCERGCEGNLQRVGELRVCTWTEKRQAWENINLVLLSLRERFHLLESKEGLAPLTVVGKEKVHDLFDAFLFLGRDVVSSLVRLT